MWQRPGYAARYRPHKLLKNDSWEKLKDIFQEALERPPHLREQFLNEACAGDDEMREEVRQLLASFDQDEEFLESPAIAEVAETIVGRREILTKGQRVGRYEVIEKIGAGGMGDVFLARDMQLERLAALKVLPELFAGDDARVSRFIREAKAASALNHPNIITIYEIVDLDGSHLIATEFIEGETLRSRQRRAPLTLPEIIDVASQVSAALGAAHAAGIIHRDIKPENIMLRSDGLVKVLDFGLAKLTEKAEVNTRTTSPSRTVATDPGIVMGTVSYMSPEQVRGIADIDPRADIWSLGVVMYEAVMGDLPFTGGTTSDVIASILKNDPRRLSDDCPAQFERIVTKTLRKERLDRYQTSDDLARDLKDLGRDLEDSWPGVLMHERPPAPTFEMPQRLTQNLKVQRFSLLHLLPIVLAVAGISAGAWWYFGQGGNAARSAISPLRTSDIMSWSSSPSEQVGNATFSPDGKLIAFTSSKSGSRNIWIKQVGTGEAIQITKDNFNNQNPVWSPDGNQLAYFSNRGSQFGIWRIPALGGSAALIATVEDGSTTLQSWSPGNRIYYNSPLKVDLSAVSVDSGHTDAVTSISEAVEMSISPDEANVAYVLKDNENRNLWIMSLNNGGPVQITRGGNEIKSIVWHPDGRRIFYNERVDGLLQVFVTDVDGSAPTQLSSADRDSNLMDISSDGTKILYGWAKEESDIWGADIANPAEFTVAADIDGELWANAAYSGTSIVYQSVRGLGQGDRLYSATIYTHEIGSDKPPALLVENAFLPLWSPDGEQIAFIQIEGDDYQIKTVSALGGIPKQVTTAGAIPAAFTVMPYNRVQDSDYSWSPDSGRIAFSSARGGYSNIWVTNADGSGETQITANADKNFLTACPIWASDGKRVAYAIRNQRRGPNHSFHYIFRLAGSGEADSGAVFEADYFVRLIGWSQNEDSLILASGPGDEKNGMPPEVNLFHVSLKTGERKPIATLKNAYIYNIDLSNDRKQIAYAANQDGKDNLWIIPAAGGGAKKITNNNDPRLYFSKLTWAADGRRVYFGKQMRYSLLSVLNDYK